jgi:hypothetical protein
VDSDHKDGLGSAGWPRITGAIRLTDEPGNTGEQGQNTGPARRGGQPRRNRPSRASRGRATRTVLCQPRAAPCSRHVTSARPARSPCACCAASDPDDGIGGSSRPSGRGRRRLDSEALPVRRLGVKQRNSHTCRRLGVAPRRAAGGGSPMTRSRGSESKSGSESKILAEILRQRSCVRVSACQEMNVISYA